MKSYPYRETPGAQVTSDTLRILALLPPCCSDVKVTLYCLRFDLTMSSIDDATSTGLAVPVLHALPRVSPFKLFPIASASASSSLVEQAGWATDVNR